MEIYIYDNEDRQNMLNMFDNLIPRKKLWKYLRKFKEFETDAKRFIDAPKDYENLKFSRCSICFVENLEFPQDDALEKDPFVKQRNV